MSATTLFYIIVFILVFEFVFGKILSFLNLQSNKGALPDELKDVFDEEKYRKTQEYESVNTRFGWLTGTFSFLLTLAMLLLQGFAWLDEFVRTYTSNPILIALFFFGILAIVSDLLSTPFDIYHTFVIEERFGFNKTNAKTYILDKLKGYVIGAILGAGLLSAFVWFYNTAGNFFWLYAWIAFTAFTLFFTMFYTSLIVPLFNKLSPLPEGELRTAIEEYAGKVNFKLDNIFVIDGSKRSAKSNAYFSGFGPKKKIVLYDTLIQQHTTSELVAVLAHEIGHYKKKHIPVSMAISVLQMGAMLFVLSLFIGNPLLSQALGVEQPGFHIGILAFGMLFSPVSLITGILFNILSRKNEFEADRYAATTYSGTELKNALKKLSANNLSNLLPHPLYVFINYSHPPLLERLRAIG